MRVSLLDEHGGFGCWDHPITHYVENPDAPKPTTLLRRRYGRGTGEKSVDATVLAEGLRSAVDAGWTPRTAASASGVGYGTVWRLVKGQRSKVRESTAKRLSDWLAEEGIACVS